MLLNEVQTYSLTHLATAPFSSAVSLDHCFAFLTEKGIDVLELAPDPRSGSPSLGCRRYFIKPPSSLPTSALGINPSDLLPHLDKDDAYALITDVTMSPKLVRTLTPTPTPCAIQWSPRGILLNQRCLLSVLTDMGGLELYNVSNKTADISSLWLQHCQKDWDPVKISPNSVSELLKLLRTRAEMVKITAMCWLGEGGRFATVSKSGLVTLWIVRASDVTTQELDVTLTAKFDCGLRNATVLFWKRLSSQSCLLIVGSHDGRIQGFIFPLTEPSSETEAITSITPSQVDIWGEQDKIAPTYIDSWSWSDGNLVVAAKGAFFLAFYLDKQGNKLTYCAYRCSDISINGATKLSDSVMLVVTRSARIIRLSLTFKSDGSLNMLTEPVESYINVSHMGCYGLNLTLNNVICFILLSVNQSYDHLRLREPTQVVICSVTGFKEPLKIIQDTHKPISELWDCLELLRVQTLQKTLESEMTYSREVLDNMSVDQLTIALWRITFAATVEEDEAKQKALLSLRGDVELLVVSCHFFKRIASLLSSPVNSLSPFQINSLGLVTKWLRWLQSMPSEFSTTLITARTLLQQLEALEAILPKEELCAICGTIVPMLASSKLFMSECEKEHQIPRCSLSLMQCCQLPYYICAQCGALAHPQAVEDCGTSCYLCGGVLRIDEDVIPLTY
ncbi:uncharacterized protein LOC129002332 isoform X1 [Macrosteles quadrilineatus]|uniref:uncharacterized protein LOC129002332 isoform X1 n=1 Tax=Macrosteles quadrilineatus TaxID=74068 RepID=UPI0023E2012B|nr:uncharacterized protein LOC129002332 isoform X1 [Macrosteles quadrilineatus]